MPVGLHEIPLVSPSVRDILLLPPRSLAIYAAGGAAVGIAFNIALNQGVRYVHRAVTKSRDYSLRDAVGHPRVFVSASLRAGVAYGSAVVFEWAYANIPAVSTAIAGFVWAMRRAVGLPSEAPYRELTGGTPLTNALASLFVFERASVFGLPIPTIGMFGISAKSLTDQQFVEVFGAASDVSDGRPARFLTPTRMVRIGMQLYAGYAAAAAIRHLVKTKVIGWRCRGREPSLVSEFASMPLALLLTMAIIRDAEFVTVFKWRLGMVGTFVVCSMVASSILAALRVLLNLAPVHVVTAEEKPVLAQEIVSDIFGDFPIQHLSPEEKRGIFGWAEKFARGCAQGGHAGGFIGALAVMTGLELIELCSNNEPLSAYENSLERLNAGLGDEVIERQVSAASIDGDVACETCPICLRAERPASQDMLTVKACGHEFHTECLSQWIKQSEECPLCRCAIERDVSASIRMQLEAFRSAGESGQLRVMEELCCRGIIAVAAAFFISPQRNINSLNELATYQPKELVELFSVVCIANTPKNVLLLSSLEAVWNSQQQLGYIFSCYMEDMAVGMVAHFVVDPLLPVPLISKDIVDEMEPPSSMLQAMGQLVVRGMHLHRM